MNANALAVTLIILVVIVTIIAYGNSKQHESNPNPEPQKPTAKSEKIKIDYSKFSKKQLEYLKSALWKEYTRILTNMAPLVVFGRLDLVRMLAEDEKFWEELREKYGLKDDPEQETMLVYSFLWTMLEAVMEKIEKIDQVIKQIEKAEQMRNYYAYNALHPRNHDGNPFNDLPGAGMIHGTDSNLWRF